MKGDSAQCLQSICNMEMFLMEKYRMPPSDINNMVLMDFEFLYSRAANEGAQKEDTGDFGKLDEKLMIYGKPFDGIKV